MADKIFRTNSPQTYIHSFLLLHLSPGAPFTPIQCCMSANDQQPITTHLRYNTAAEVRGSGMGVAGGNKEGKRMR